jgi:carbon-monoxide dehydrogenase medium subunit
MKPSGFDYHAPESIDEAVALLAQLGDGAKVLAGGQSLVPMISLRLAYFDHLVDIGRIDALRGIHAEADAIVIGATTVDAAVEHDAEVAARVPLLARATPFVGHFQIRNRGTLGGSIAHADPAAEYPAIALALDAELEAVSPRGRRSIHAGAFFDGFWTTALAPDELLVGVRFPSWRGPTPLRATAAEQAVLGGRNGAAADELGQLAVSELTEVPSDLHGSARYRRRVGAAMVTRAWQEAIEEATRG